MASKPGNIYMSIELWQISSKFQQQIQGFDHDDLGKNDVNCQQVILTTKGNLKWQD